MGKITWQPGEKLSAEKLNSLLQSCRIKTMDIRKDNDGNNDYYYLSKSAGEIIETLNNNEFFIIIRYKSAEDLTKYIFFIAHVQQSQSGYTFSTTTCSESAEIHFWASNLTDFPTTNQIIDDIIKPSTK